MTDLELALANATTMQRDARLRHNTYITLRTDDMDVLLAAVRNHLTVTHTRRVINHLTSHNRRDIYHEHEGQPRAL